MTFLQILAQTIDPIQFTPTDNSWISIAIASVGFIGAGISAWLTYKASVRQKELDKESTDLQEKAARLEKTKEIELEKARLQYEARESDLKRQSEFFEKILTDYESLRKSHLELESTVRKLKDELEKVEQSLEFYRGNSAVVESYSLLDKMTNLLPMPAWIHDVSNNKWYLNDSYCQKFNVSRKHFWDGVNILSRYDQDDVLRYQQNNILVVQEGRTQEVYERARCYIMDPKCPNFIYGRFSKSPIEINNKTFILGYMIEEVSEAEYNKHNGNT